MAQTRFGNDESPLVYNDNDFVGESGWTLTQIVDDIQHLSQYVGAPSLMDIMAEYDLTLPEALMVVRKAGMSLHVTCERCGGDGWDHNTGWWVGSGMQLHCPRCGGSGIHLA